MYTLEKKKTKINHWNFHLRKQGRWLIKSKASRRQIIKIRAEIKSVENSKSAKKMTETKSWFFEKTNKITKPLARLRKKERKDTLLLSEAKEEISVQNPMISKWQQRNTMNYIHKFDNIDEMDQFLGRHNWPKLIQETTDSLNRLVSIC